MRVQENTNEQLGVAAQGTARSLGKACSVARTFCISVSNSCFQPGFDKPPSRSMRLYREFLIWAHHQFLPGCELHTKTSILGTSSPPPPSSSVSKACTLSSPTLVLHSAQVAGNLIWHGCLPVNMWLWHNRLVVVIGFSFKNTPL